MRKILRISAKILVAALILVVAVVVAGWCAVRASLPKLDGDIKLGSLSAPVALTRDADGTVAITAQNAFDAMRALGYVHAQERFFEMDLARRAAAGELSALFGAATLSIDKEKRQHRMRARMEAQYRAASAEERTWIAAYTDGVNSGLNAFPIRPWQYLLLRSTPEAWREVDSLLVLAEMYFMLQGNPIEKRFSEIQLRKYWATAPSIGCSRSAASGMPHSTAASCHRLHYRRPTKSMCVNFPLSTSIPARFFMATRTTHSSAATTGRLAARVPRMAAQCSRATCISASAYRASGFARS